MAWRSSSKPRSSRATAASKSLRFRRFGCTSSRLRRPISPKFWPATRRIPRSSTRKRTRPVSLKHSRRILCIRISGHCRKSAGISSSALSLRRSRRSWQFSIPASTLSIPGFSQNLQDALDYAWSKNVVLVAATGNDAVSTPTFPAGDRGVMGVSGTDPNDALAPFSNSGPSVFISAPATEIQTTTTGDAYTVISGTSASAAIVAGAAAFMKAVDPTLSNGIIVGRLARMADPAGTQDQTGNGRINMAPALADTGTEFIQPAGAAPVGNGGPV